MSKDKYQSSPVSSRHQPASRRTKRKTIRKIVETSVRILFFIPFLCVIVLCVKVYQLRQTMGNMETQLTELKQVTEKQQEELETCMKKVGSQVQPQIVIEATAADATDNANIADAETGLDKDTQAASEDEAGAGETAGQNDVEALHKVYLTFDDGPSIYTDDILAILDRYQVKATFFVVGKDNKTANEFLCKIVEGGHTLGLHSYSHDYNELYQSVEGFAEDFNRIQEHVYEVTGQKSKAYRFPGGSSNTISEIDMKEFAEYLAEQGVEFYDWNISAGDGVSKQQDVDTIVENCTQGITKRGTTIILMHDSAEKSTTVEALPIIIEKIQAMEDTAILPITEDTKPVQHIDTKENE